MPCDIQRCRHQCDRRGSSFSSLLIGICLVTSPLQPPRQRCQSFQFPSHRDMPCDLWQSRLGAPLSFATFSSLLIGICLVTDKIKAGSLTAKQTFSSLLIGICLVTHQRRPEWRKRHNRFQFPSHRDMPCDCGAHQSPAFGVSLSVPFSSGYAL